MNSLKHGLTAQRILLPHEDHAAFHEVAERLRRELKPEGELESALVDRIAAMIWRLPRCGELETGILTWLFHGIRVERAEKEAAAHIHITSPSLPTAKILEEYQPTTEILDPPKHQEARLEQKRCQSAQETDTATLGEAFIRDSREQNALSNLSRYETSLERSFFKALHELQRLQAARRGKDLPLPIAVDVDVSGNEDQEVDGFRPTNHK